MKLNNQNTHFANVNSARPVWWLTIPMRKVGKQLHLLLKKTNGNLIWLRIPPNIFDRSKRFYYRKDWMLSAFKYIQIHLETVK